MLYSNKVRQFHKTFKHPAPDEIVEVVDKELIKQRIQYMLEEIDEIAKAADLNVVDIVSEMEQQNKFKPIPEDHKGIPGVLDGLVDLEYFLHGTLVAVGIPTPLFNTAFEKVHKANMDKLCTNVNLPMTLQMYKDKGIDVIAEPVEKGFIITRVDNNKVVKPFGYKAASITKIIDDYYNGEQEG